MTDITEKLVEAVKNLLSYDGAPPLTIRDQLHNALAAYEESKGKKAAALIERLTRERDEARLALTRITTKLAHGDRTYTGAISDIRWACDEALRAISTGEE